MASVEVAELLVVLPCSVESADCAGSMITVRVEVEVRPIWSVASGAILRVGDARFQMPI